jgi:site-specific recombinase XerD
MAVYLRKKNLASGRKSLYLDIWHEEKRHYEFLKLYITKARNPIDKKSNEAVKELAENIRAKRELDLQASVYGYIPKFRQNTDFLDFYESYLDKYKNKDVRLVKGSLKHFRGFLEEGGIKVLPAKSIDEQMCRDFKNYLEQKVHGETVFNYFKKFKAAIKQAVKENILLKDVSEKITVSRTSGLKKDILNIDEIQKLADIKCNNDQVKRAFLFCLNTGLRFCDVTELRWNNIDKNKLRYTQKKVQHSSEAAINDIDLNRTASKIIGQRGQPDEKIFNLPSHTGCLKSLKTWIKAAGIDKHITWHCARHSFAVNLLDSEVAGADVKTVAALLGHSDLNHVNIYLRVIDERKKQAVNRLPEIEIS